MGGKFGYIDNRDFRVVIHLEKGERFVGFKWSNYQTGMLSDLQFIIARKP
jgi:hypothetical protein